MKNQLIIYILLVLPLLSCVNDKSNVEAEAPENPASISPLAENFLNEVIGIMETKSINKYAIDWPAFRN